MCHRSSVTLRYRPLGLGWSIAELVVGLVMLQSLLGDEPYPLWLDSAAFLVAAAFIIAGGVGVVVAARNGDVRAACARIREALATPRKAGGTVLWLAWVSVVWAALAAAAFAVLIGLLTLVS